MASYVVLSGRLVQDPELRHTTTGTPVASFSVAVDRPFKNKEGQREVDFFDCVAWRGTGETVARYFKKGRRILVNGALQTRTYEAKDGSRRKVTEVVVNSIEFIDSRPNNGDATDGEEPELVGVAAGVDDVPDDLPF